MAVGQNVEIDQSARLANLEAAVFAGQLSGAAIPTFAGIELPPIQVMATTGAAAVKAQGGLVVFTAAGAVLATLVQPVVGAPAAVTGGQDGMTQTFLDANAQANTITTAANGINTNKHIATDGGVLANQITFRAYNGTWYAQTNTGFTIT